jgi:hypothetical protein
MKKQARKLRLSRETLLGLNDPELTTAVGAATLDPSACGTNCTVCNHTDTCTLCSNRCQ